MTAPDEEMIEAGYRALIACKPMTSTDCEREACEAIYTAMRALAKPDDGVADLEAALAPFAAMARVMETRARVTFGESVKDSEIVCESSGEAGMGILTMGHFRDAAALLPNATGWRGLYRPPFDRAASIASLATGDDGIAQETGK